MTSEDGEDPPKKAKAKKAPKEPKPARVKKEEAVEVLDVGGHAVRVTNPEKLYFRAANVTKLALVKYYLSVAEGALAGVRDRPFVLKRFVNGAEGEVFYQKRAPEKLPPFLRTAQLSFPSGRVADEIVIDDAAGLAWVINLGCIELHPHPVRSGDLHHPDELRVDLDPGPGVPWAHVREVALVAKSVLDDCKLVGFPKTSGSRGLHINVRIHPEWGFDDVRRAALALAREVERRAPKIATSKWWKEERHGVFIDYNQNAKDRTTCSAYSVRPLPDARVSTPLEWSEVADCEPADFTIRTVPERFARLGNPLANVAETAASLDLLLELSLRDEATGLGDAPWPPHYPKSATEGSRVAPSRAKKPAGAPPPAPKKVAIPQLIVARSNRKEDALAGLERWKARHPEAAKYVAVEDVLVDTMRARFSPWFRIRVLLRNVPEELRPAEEPPDPDDATSGWPGHPGVDR